MRHQPDLVDLHQRRQPRPCRAEAGGLEAEPVHAAFQLEKHMMRPVGLVRRQPVDLRLAVNDMPQPEPRAGVEIAGLEGAFEQQHRAAPAERAQPLGFGEVEQREAVGRVQPVEGTLDAVSVGVGLHHRPDLRLRRGRACAGQVVCQRIDMDYGLDGARHRRILPVDGPSPWRRTIVDATARARMPHPATRGGWLPMAVKPACYNLSQRESATGRRRQPASVSGSTPPDGHPSCPRPHEKRFLHHHVGAVFQLTG